MKIGILTYHSVYNFGANLQALSTVEYLRNKGHEPIIIDFFPETLKNAFDRSVPLTQAEYHKSFFLNHFVFTKRCISSIEVAREIENNNLEAVIIGSDAVVQHVPLLSRIRLNPSRKKILNFHILPKKVETSFPNPFWGEFVEFLQRKIPVAMMSVSCQNTDFRLFSCRVKKDIYNMINKINYISVRDRRTYELYKYVSHAHCLPRITPDPVFAFNNNVECLPSKQDLCIKYNLPDKYILLSFNSTKVIKKSWVETFQSIAEKYHYHCIALAMPGGIKFQNNLKKQIDIPLDPLDWYTLIKYSSAYIGEKMHPVIVSLHNSVPFFSFDHYGIKRLKFYLNQKSSKIYQILEKAQMLDYRTSIRYNTLKSFPKPEFVLQKIQSFDRGKCSKFAMSMSREYEEMMEDILRVLSNK